MNDLVQMADSAALNEAIHKAAFAPVGVKRIRMSELLRTRTEALKHELGKKPT